MVIGALRVGGRAYLDDFRRPDEQQIARNWALSFPDVFASRVLRVGHEILVLEKLKPCRDGRVRLGVVADATRANCGRAAAYFLRGVRRVGRSMSFSTRREP